MSPRRSARIASLAHKDRQNECVEQPVVTPKKKVRSKKSVENTPTKSTPIEGVSFSPKNFVCEEEALIPPLETPIDKGKSKESVLPSINKIVQHSDGSKSVFEPIDSSWLQKRKLEQSHIEYSNNWNNEALKNQEFPEN